MSRSYVSAQSSAGAAACPQDDAAEEEGARDVAGANDGPAGGETIALLPLLDSSESMAAARPTAGLAGFLTTASALPEVLLLINVELEFISTATVLRFTMLPLDAEATAAAALLARPWPIDGTGAEMRALPVPVREAPTLLDGPNWGILA